MQNSRNPSLTILTGGRIGNGESILANAQPLYPTGMSTIPDRKEMNTNEYRKLQADVEAKGGLLPNPEFSHYISSNNVGALYPIGINPNSFCEDC